MDGEQMPPVKSTNIAWTATVPWTAIIYVTPANAIIFLPRYDRCWLKFS